MVSAIAYGGVLDSFADLDLTYLFTFSIECRETKLSQLLIPIILLNQCRFGS